MTTIFYALIFPVTFIFVIVVNAIADYQENKHDAEYERLNKFYDR